MINEQSNQSINHESNLGMLEDLLRLYYFTCVSGEKRKEFMIKKELVLTRMTERRDG